MCLARATGVSRDALVTTRCDHVFVHDEPTLDQLEYSLDTLYTLTKAIHRKFLEAVADFDRREAWKHDGVHSMRDWLTYRYGDSVHTANQTVSLAHALEERPAIAAGFENGTLSTDKVTDLCSFVPPEEDESYAHYAQYHNAAQVKEWARHARRMKREEAARAVKERSLRMYWDRHREVLHVNGVLPGAEGAAVKAAIDRVAEQLGPDDDGTWPLLERRRADALIELAGTKLAEDTDTDRATVVVHVDAHELNYIHGIAKLEDGPMIPSEVARRLACDGRIQPVVDGPSGEPLGIGRRSRMVPHWLMRLLKDRDRGCVVNGCGRTLGLQAHHLAHWAHGGRTDMDNLVLVCRRCHRKIHDEGFRLVRNQYGNVRVLRPDGRPVMNRPAPMRPDVKERMLGPARARSPALRC